MSHKIQIIAVVLIAMSVTAVFAAVAVDFFQYNDRDDTEAVKRSPVATGSMIGFFILYYAAIRFRVGAAPHFNAAFMVIGALLVISGAGVNIAGRIQLGRNWANHIKIYSGHTFVQTGVYRVARHPLYASLILMMAGGSLAYLNWLTAVLTAVVFIPMLNYRAKQEEVMLGEAFPEYTAYMEAVGRFYPKIWRRRQHGRI